MPRDIDTNTQSALSETVSPVAVMVDLEIGGAFTYVWSGYGNLVWNGNTYQGVGKLGNVSVVQETNSVYATSATISLEGVNDSDLESTMDSLTIGSTCTIYLATIGNGVIVGTPVPIFSGLTDQGAISESTNTTSVSIDIESKMSQLQRNREYRWTDQMQRFLYPNDGALRYTNTLQNWLGTWGFQNNDD